MTFEQLKNAADEHNANLDNPFDNPSEEEVLAINAHVGPGLAADNVPLSAIIRGKKVVIGHGNLKSDGQFHAVIDNPEVNKLFSDKMIASLAIGPDVKAQYIEPRKW